MDPSILLSFAASVAATFLIVSYVCAAATEGLASAFQVRARMLLRSILKLLGETRHRAPITLRIYTNYSYNPLFNPPTAAPVTSLSQVTTRPAVVDKKTFASALMAAVGLTGSDPDAMRAAVSAAFSENRDLVPLAENLIDRNADTIREGKLDKLQEEIGNWFERSTVSTRDEYRQLTQITNFVIGLALAILLGLNPLPPDLVKQAPNELTARLLGYLIVATSTLFGAPFWFGLLTKIIPIGPTASSPSSGAPPPPAGAPAAAAPPGSIGPGPVQPPAQPAPREPIGPVPVQPPAQPTPTPADEPPASPVPARPTGST